MWYCNNLFYFLAPAAAAPAAKEEKKEEKKKEESEEEDDDMGFGMLHTSSENLQIILTIFVLQVCSTKGNLIHFCFVSSHGSILCLVQIHQEFHESFYLQNGLFLPSYRANGSSTIFYDSIAL